MKTKFGISGMERTGFTSTGAWPSPWQKYRLAMGVHSREYELQLAGHPAEVGF